MNVVGIGHEITIAIGQCRYVSSSTSNLITCRYNLEILKNKITNTRKVFKKVSLQSTTGHVETNQFVICAGSRTGLKPDSKVKRGKSKF